MEEFISERIIKSNVINNQTVINVTDIIKVDNSDFESRVKIVAYLKDIDLADVAKQFGISQKNNFIARLNTGRLRFAEQRKIAELLGVDIVIKLVIGDHEIVTNSATEMIREACAYKQKTLFSLSNDMGISRQALNTKLKGDRFDYNELTKIVSLLDGEYYNYFIVDDMRI